MELTDHITRAIARTRTSFSSDKGKMIDYLERYELKGYFSEGVSDDDKRKRESFLEQKLNEHLNKYDEELGSLTRKVAGGSAMGLAIANDVYAYVSNVPFVNVGYLAAALTLAKMGIDAPYLYRYAKKSHDWYGAITNFVLKPARMLLPVVGPALEAGAFERMVRKQVMHETKLAFIKEIGEYMSANEHLDKSLNTRLGDVVYKIEPKEYREAA